MTPKSANPHPTSRETAFEGSQRDRFRCIDTHAFRRVDQVFDRLDREVSGVVVTVTPPPRRAAERSEHRDVCGTFRKGLHLQGGRLRAPWLRPTRPIEARWIPPDAASPVPVPRPRRGTCRASTAIRDAD
jgi:hypothetical protein